MADSFRNQKSVEVLSNIRPLWVPANGPHISVPTLWLQVWDSWLLGGSLHPTLAGGEKSERFEGARGGGRTTAITKPTCCNAFSHQPVNATGLLGAHLIVELQLVVEK